MDNPRIDQALRDLGLELSEIEKFSRGESVVYKLRTQSDPGIAMIEFIGDRLRSGIIEINDPGNGLKNFLRFRDRSLDLAIELGASELEIFAAVIINRRLEALLVRRGFRSYEVAVPDDLGGGTMTILADVQAVRRTGE